MKLWYRLSDGQMYPRGHGFVYQSMATRSCYTCLIPFNRIARVLWCFWLWLKCPVRFFESAQRYDFYKRKWQQRGQDMYYHEQMAKHYKDLYESKERAK